MHYLVGIDEAGYGPNLGPLVISATLWQVPEGVRSEDLYDRLSAVIASAPHRATESPPSRVVVADSKVLYSSGNGLRHLERGLFAVLSLLGHCPQSWRQIWEVMASERETGWMSLPWHAAYDEPLPLEIEPSEVSLLSSLLAKGLAKAEIRFVAMRSRTVFPAEFNGLVDRLGSKGTALSHVTLGLVTQLLEPLANGTLSVLCDKHGGRNCYAPLLQQFFPDWLVEVHGEGRERSTYRFGPPERRVEFRFQTRAESCLPVAMASMSAKYLRELAMRAFNTFWCTRVSDLKPTAGYPQDAKRFKAAIAPMQAELKIDDRVLWRTR